MKTKLKDYLRYLISIYQIFGGLAGIWFAVSGGINFKVLNLLVLIAALGLFSFSILTGVRLFSGSHSGYKFSIVNQALQIVKIKIFGYGLGYYSGFKALIGFTDTPELKLFFDFHLDYSSGFFIFIGNSANEISLLFNVIPIILIVYLSNRIKKM